MKHLYTLFLLFAFVGNSWCGAIDFTATHIGTTEGLSQTTVRSICIAQNGFVWIGTLDGLNRFDGKDFVVYKQQLGNHASLSDPRIRSITEDASGRLWVAKYDNTFSCYDPVLDKFIDISDANGNIVGIDYSGIFKSADSTIFLFGGANGGATKINVTSAQQPMAVWVDTTHRYNDMVQDHKQTAWLCGNCLTAVEPDGKTQTFEIDGIGNARAVEIAGQNLFMVGDNNKLIVFDINRRQFLPPVAMHDGTRLINCKKADDSRLLLSTRRHGLIVFDTENFTTVDKASVGAQHIGNGASFVTDNRGGVWVYDHSGLIYRYDTADGRFEPIRAIEQEVVKSIDNERYVVHADTAGTYWITTYGGGLICYEPETGQTTNIRNDGTADGLSSDYLLSIAEDKYGNMWIGCEYSGLVKLSPKQYYFNRLRPETATILGKDNNIRVVYEDEDENIWVGMKNGSLYVYDKELTRLIYTRQGINPYAMTHDKNGRIWIGTKGNGVYVYDRQTMTETAHFSNDSSDPNSLCHNHVFDILTDNVGRVWIATFGNGLDLVIENDGKTTFKHFFDNNDNKAYIRTLFEDHGGTIWAGSYDGLIRFEPDRLIENPQNYVIYQYDIDNIDGINCKDIKAICEDDNQNIWLGTAGGGLNKLYFADGQAEFEKFTMSDGLPSDIVSSLMCTDGILWVGTENGLVRFDINQNKSVNVEPSKDAYGNFFNENACAKRRNGNLVFGTLDGIISFDPQTLIRENILPKPTLTGLSLNGRRAGTMAEDSPLEKSIEYTDNIKLNYNQNTFVISFATLNLTNQLSNKYTYILEGIDTEWSQPSASNYALYRHIDPGEYVFKVRNATDPETEFTAMAIAIRPPWWNSVPARIAYAVLFVALLIFTYFIVNKIARLKNSIAFEQQLTNYKLRFFTNVSHEFRTPLTLMKGIIDSLVDESANLPDNIKHHINMLVRNTTHLSRLIDQLLEFRKLQNNVMTLNLERTNVSAYVADIFNSFADMAEQKNIRYTLDVPESWNILIDRNKVEKIVYNYISNAFKFTAPGGFIGVRVHRSETNNCVMSVTDTGCGVPKSKQNQLFKRFAQANYSAGGTGIGLSLVKEFAEAHHGRVYFTENPGGGSIFSVELPTDYSNYTDINIIDQNKIFVTDKNTPAGNDTAADNDSARTIVVIDDNQDIRNFLTMQLSADYTVYSAENGKEGYEIIVKHQPDLIVCDVKMPIMDGIALTQKVRKNFNTSHIPIILLTAHPSDQIAMESSESGADEYIMKPFNFKYLLSRVRKLIEQREVLRRRYSMQVNKPIVETESNESEFVQKLNAIIEKNASEPNFDLDILVTELKMSRSNIYKKLRAIAGCTPGEYVKIYRMNKAKELILKGGMTVSQVAMEIGMTDPFYFSKCFKRQFGCSPSKFSENNSTPPPPLT